LLAKRPSSPGSSSTGVKISADAQSQDSVAVVEPIVARGRAGGNGGGDDDDDGWGDDW
jgi:hypothetical protein